MDKSINIILKEVIDNFIKEELSINNELENAVEDAAIKILEKYRNNDIIDERTISIMYKDTIYQLKIGYIAIFRREFNHFYLFFCISLALS